MTLVEPSYRLNPVDPREQFAEGKFRRSALARTSHADAPLPGERDPVGIVERQSEGRIPELVPIRYGRMLISPFTFYRGSAAVMAADLGRMPHSGIFVHSCGDAHLLNFGVFATKERRILFDVNDFDEGHHAPFEWDVKRLAASMVLAARDNGCKRRDQREAARACVRSYREKMLIYARMGYLDVWNARVDIDAVLPILEASMARGPRQVMAKLEERTSVGSLDRLTRMVNGARRLREDPPLQEHVQIPGGLPALEAAIEEYKTSLLPYRRELVSMYGLVDYGRRVVGVGSVGLDAWVTYFQGRDDEDVIFLQIKQAVASVLNPYVETGIPHEHEGKRVVFASRVMQAASDLFLGWFTGGSGAQYYVRQLRDMKGSVRTENLAPPSLVAYGVACGWTLARAHARSGYAAMVAGYLGTSDRFDRAIEEFSVTYSDQVERDYAAMKEAASSGRLEVVEGV